MRGLRLVVVALTLLALAPGARSAAPEEVAIRAAMHDGFGRIAFDWPAPVGFEARAAKDTLTIHFARPLHAQSELMASALADYIASADVEDAGKTLVVHLKRPMMVSSFIKGATIVIDLKPAPAAKAAPPKPEPAKSEPAPTEQAKAEPAKSEPAAKASSLTPVRLSATEKDGAAHVTFSWPRPVGFALTEKGDAAKLIFHAGGDIDAAALTQMLPALAPAIAARDGETVVALSIPKGVHLKIGHVGPAITLETRGKPLASKPAAPPPVAAAPEKPAEPPPPVAAADKPAAPPPPAASADPPPVANAEAPSSTSAPAPAPTAPVPPPASVAVRFATDAAAPSLRFEWPMATATAVFSRGSVWWIVFATPTALDLTDPLARGQQAIAAIAQLPLKDATVLRLELRAGLTPSVRRSGTAWIVDLKSQPTPPDAPIVVEANPSATPAMVAFRVHQASAPVQLADAEIGTLVVVPVGELGRGIIAPPLLVDFRALPTLQGIVIRPFSDDLAVHVGDDAVEVTRPDGLVLSGDRDRLLGHAPDRARALFDFNAWRGPQDVDYTERRAALERAIAEAPKAGRSEPRLALARFYFANLFGAETLAVLDAVGRDDPQTADQPVVHALHGAACLLVADLKCATDELGQHGLDRDPEMRLWRAALASAAGDADTAAHNFLESASVLATYPKTLRERFALQGATALIATGRGSLAGALTDLVLKDQPEPAAAAEALYLDGKRAQEAGKLDDALALWDKAAAFGDPRVRAWALYARALALQDSGRASAADTIKALDGLRFAWRGDDFELTLLRKLGDLRLAEGDESGGIDVLEQAVINFPDNPAAKDIIKQTSDAFAGLFLGPHGDDLPPLKSLALYDQFHDLEPVGERGDRIVRKLIDRLVAVDLLDRAAGLLEEQVTKRLAGAEKQRGATQLALLRLMDHRPEEALKALDLDIGRDVPPELARQRQQLRARVVMDLGRPGDALALLKDDQSRDADRLRADIYWKGKDWKEAAKTLSRLAGSPSADGKVDAETGRIVVSLAAALTLADDQTGLGRLRAQYGDAMGSTSFAGAFRVLAGSGADASADPRTFASQVAQIGELQNFMASFKQKLASGAKVGAVN